MSNYQDLMDKFKAERDGLVLPENCSDHSCVFGHPGGMGTNGGCRCIRNQPEWKIGRDVRRITDNNKVLLVQAEAQARLLEAMKIEHGCVLLMTKSSKANSDEFRNAASSAELAALDTECLIAELAKEHT